MPCFLVRRPKTHHYLKPTPQKLPNNKLRTYPSYDFPEQSDGP